MDKTVGVLGGGQLGRMLTEAANNLNIRILTLDAANSPAKQINADPSHVTGHFADAESIRRLASQVDVLTVEIEHVDTQVLEQLAAESGAGDGKASGLSIQPSWKTIRAIQDKFQQKKLLIRGGVATANSLAVDNSEVADVEEVASLLGGYPLMLKARTDAYDGRGNYALKSAKDIPEALKVLGDRRLYAEQWANFKMELAIMVVKIDERAGQEWEKSTLAYPAVETVHEDSICKLVYCPPRNVLPTALVEARALARRAVAGFEGKGIFGVEMFLLEDGKLLINEIAPRPHNSGHFSIEACAMSQYEAHLRAILGLPIPPMALEADRASVMLNILGGAEKDTHLKVAEAALYVSRAAVHLYGKGDGRPKRKMGHITVTAKDVMQAEKAIAPLIQIVDAVRDETKKPKVLSSLQNALTSKKNVDELPKPFGGSRKPVVLITMGSDSDLKVLKPGIELLEELAVPHRVTITSAHRTPDRMFKVAGEAEAEGIKVIIAAAGGAAHLPGMVAAKSSLPVIGVPVKGSVLDGQDSLYSIVQMPPGCPVASMGINNSRNAALYAMHILALFDDATKNRLEKFMTDQRDTVIEKAKRLEEVGAAKYTWP